MSAVLLSGHVTERKTIAEADFQCLLKRLEADVENNPGFYADASIHQQIQTHRNTQVALQSDIPNEDMANASTSTESSSEQPASTGKPFSKNVTFPDDEQVLKQLIEIDAHYPCPDRSKPYPTQARPGNRASLPVRAP